MHDWSRIPAGLFHHFHQDWSVEIARELNRGRLPGGFGAFVEQRSGRVESDVLALEGSSYHRSGGSGTVATLVKPAARIIQRSEKELYARNANRIAIKHKLGRTVAVIEIVSPGNKDGRGAFRDFVEKSVEYLKRGIHLIVVDLLPPTPRDPLGIHKAIWDEIDDEPFTFPAGTSRILASYNAGPEKVAYVEPLGVGDRLPDMPVFLTDDAHIPVPLELTYAATWDQCPDFYRTAVETGVMPTDDDGE